MSRIYVLLSYLHPDTASDDLQQVLDEYRNTVTYELQSYRLMNKCKVKAHPHNFFPDLVVAHDKGGGGGMRPTVSVHIFEGGKRVSPNKNEIAIFQSVIVELDKFASDVNKKQFKTISADLERLRNQKKK